MIPSTRTRRASRRKSTSPSMPRLRSSSKRSMLFLATVVLLVGFVTSIKDDAVAFFVPPGLRYTTCRDFTWEVLGDDRIASSS